MIDIPNLHNQQIVFKQTDISDKNKLPSKSGNSATIDTYTIERDYELKNIYYDSNGNEVDKNSDLVKNNAINKSTIKVKWDYKTGLVAFDFAFIDKNSVYEITIKVNDDISLTTKPNFKFENKLYTQLIYSTNFKKQFKLSDIKSLQIILKSSSITKTINIVFGTYKNMKYDFMIPRNKRLCLEFQNLIILKGEEFNSKFMSLSIKPIDLKQGFWNKRLIEIDQNDSDVFERNSVVVSLLDKLPISSKSIVSFNAFIESDNDKSYISINENTYYDTSKKETMKGFGKNSQPGYIVPFEFSGLFYPVLALSINGANIKISWEQNFDKPYFKMNEGINKVSLTTSYNENKNNKWTQISSDLLEEAKEYNFNYQELINWLNYKTNF